MTSLDAELRSRLPKAVKGWIEKLDKQKGQRSRLRRAQGQADVLAVELAHRLAAELGRCVRDADAPYFLAGLLAQLRDPQGPKLIAELTRGAVEGKPETWPLKLQRFGQLLHADELPARLRLFRRVLALIGNKADAVDLSYQFLTWDDNATKRDFARRYFTPRSDHDGDSDAQAASSDNSA